MAYAELTDVEVDFGPVAEQDTVEKVHVLIDRAEARIEQVMGASLAALVAAGKTTDILARQVVSEMVCSVLRNPNCWSSESETLGGLSRSHTVNLAAASGLLRFTGDHRDLLSEGGSAAGVGGGAFTIRPGGHAPRTVPTWGW